MRAVPASMMVCGILALAGAVSAQETASSIAEVVASWSIGDGAMATNSSARIAAIDDDLRRLLAQRPEPFAGKIGPCSKRLRLRYSDTASLGSPYYFTSTKMIVLAPGKDHSGSEYDFDSSSYPSVSKLLSEVASSVTCKP